jgi:hypothetical protein
MRGLTLKNFFIPVPQMACPTCGDRHLVCRRFVERPRRIMVICWRCETETWVEDFR